jgi:hypothetical protein
MIHPSLFSSRSFCLIPELTFPTLTSRDRPEVAVPPRDNDESGSSVIEKDVVRFRGKTDPSSMASKVVMVGYGQLVCPKTMGIPDEQNDEFRSE